MPHADRSGSRSTRALVLALLCAGSACAYDWTIPPEERGASSSSTGPAYPSPSSGGGGAAQPADVPCLCAGCVRCVFDSCDAFAIQQCVDYETCVANCPPDDVTCEASCRDMYPDGYRSDSCAKSACPTQCSTCSGM